MFNWESDDNEVMINPRFSDKEMQEVLAMLKQSPALKGHVWMATTGTSGHIKWAALSKSAILTSANTVNTFLHSTNNDVWVNPLPRFHVGGLGIQARGHLSRAAVVDAFSAMQGKWNTLQFYKLLCESKGSLTSLVPAQAYDLASLQLPAPSIPSRCYRWRRCPARTSLSQSDSPRLEPASKLWAHRMLFPGSYSKA